MSKDFPVMTIKKSSTIKDMLNGFPISPNRKYSVCRTDLN